MKINSFDFLSVCDFQGGTQPPKSEFKTTLKEGYIRLLQIQDFNDDSKAIFVPNTNKLKTCESDDILLGRYGASIGRVLTGKQGAYNVAIVKLKPDPRRLDKRFLFHFVSSPKFQFFIQNTSGRAAQAGFNKKDFENLQIPLPPIAQQKRIAAILDKADAVRRKRRETIRLTEELLRSTFLEMFGNPVTNPKCWPLVPMSSVIVNIKAGQSLKGDERIRESHEWAVLKVSAITSGRFLKDEYKVVDESEINKTPIIPKKGDLLFSRANTQDLVGATCIVEDDIEKIFLSDKLWRLDLNQTIVKPEYLKLLLSDPKYRYLLARKATGTSGSMLNISQPKLLEMYLPLPPIQLQKHFHDFYWNIVNLRFHQESYFQKSDNLFNSLLQRAFTGDL